MAITVDTTSVDLLIPEMFSKLVIRETERNLVYAGTFDRKYEKEMSGKAYDQINVGTISNFSVSSNITLGVAGSLTADTPANDPELDFNIAINTHAYKFFDLETEAQMLTDVDILEEYAKKAAYSVQWKIDTDCAAFIDDFDVTVGTLAVDLTDDKIVEAVQKLQEANVGPGDLFYVHSPKQQAAHRLQERFGNALYSAAVGQIKNQVRGEYANIHGLRWISSTNTEGTNAAGHDNGIYHRDSVALCILDNMRRKQVYEIDTDSEKLAIHALYGALEVRGGAYTSTAGQMGGWGIWAKGA